MKSFTLNRNSWHYWLATKLGAMDTYYEHRIDFCGYSRKVMLGAFFFTLSALLVTTVLASFGCTLGWIAAMIVTSSLIAPEPFCAVSLAFCLFGVVFGIGYLFTMYKDYLRRHPKAQPEDYVQQQEKGPGFMALAYRKFKDKTCFKVQFQG